MPETSFLADKGGRSMNLIAHSTQTA